MPTKVRIADNMVDLIGETPLVYLKRMRGERPGIVAAKLECFSPSGSIKDRTACYMIRDAEVRGQLKPGGTIIEPSSGNTAISLAACAAGLGYRVILVMPESAPDDRKKIVRAYGAEVVTTPAEQGMKGALLCASELHQKIENSFMPGLFFNPANPDGHERNTAREIWQDTAGEVAAVVAGIGSGGTITGIGRCLKRKRPDVRIVGVEPLGSAVLSENRLPEPRKGSHCIEGLGAGFIPQVLDCDILDEVIAVNEDDAITTARAIARTEGLLAGLSSGAAAAAALQVAEREEFRDKLIIVIFPDNGLKYLCTELFE